MGRAGAMRAAIGAATAIVLGLGLAPIGSGATAAETTCIGSTAPADLTALFDLEPDGLFAADYQRALTLPDGRVLWTFQDASIRIDPPPPPGEPTERVVHNAALVQTGTCFERLRSGTDADLVAWLFPNETEPLERWFWPLDATMGADGFVWVFLAEMIERGPTYLSHTEPVATHVVSLDPTTLQPVGSGRPFDAGPALYGFSITEDSSWTYLYAQCHRQFGYDPTIFGTNGHDMSCVGDVTVARVPRGRVLDPPAYWNGASWQPDPARAVGVIPTGSRLINPTQVTWTGQEFLAVTKEGDWLGDTIYFDRAPNAYGPWTRYAQVPAVPKCAPNECNTYFASWIPQPGGGLAVGLSHNRWDGVISPVNRPTFFDPPPPPPPPPPRPHAPARRCSLVGC